MKKLLSILFALISFSAFAQVAPKYGGVSLRVNDSATYISSQATAHALGYADLFWNNQATVPHMDIWNGSAYVHVFDFNGGGGGGAVSSVFSRTGAVTAQTGDYDVTEVTGAAPLASPTFTGTPSLPTGTIGVTQTQGDNSTNIATTAYVDAAAIVVDAALSTVNDTNITLTASGDPTNALLSATTLSMGWVGVLGTTRGGTGSSTNFTAGSVVFTGSGGSYAQDNASLFFDDTNNRLGIGTASPTAKLHLPAGTATASTAPLKIPDGTNLTTPEDGAIEHSSDNLNFTAGSTRYTLAKTLTATAALNFDLTSVNSEDLTITVTGAADGDAVSVGVPNASATANVIFTWWTSGANTVTIRASRIDVTSGADPASGTFRAAVIKY